MTAASPFRAKPQVLQVQPENIPELLRQQRSWICWKAGSFKPSGKFDKVPVDPSTGGMFDGRKPAHWRTFAEVTGAYHRGIADGIGFALSDQHPVIVDGVSLYVTVVDLDQCGSRMDEWQALWWELGQPFTEVSPSGNGLHMWALSRSPLKGGNAGGGRELYSGGRFVTMTGIGVKGTFGDCPGLAGLEQRWFPPEGAGAFPALPVVGGSDLPGNLLPAPTGGNWFDRLSPDDKNACLAEMLQVPAVIALAGLLDNAPEPNWRTVLAACARSGAPNAYSLCRAWAGTSRRFDSGNFDLRWRSYSRG